MNEYGRPTRLDEAARAVHVAQRCGTDRRPACHVPLPARQGYHINLTVNYDRRQVAKPWVASWHSPKNPGLDSETVYNKWTIKETVQSPVTERSSMPVETVPESNDFGMGNTLGYARVSTNDQNLEGQRVRLIEAGAIRVFVDVVSGKRFEHPGLAELIDHARPGGRLCVTRLDRLGRSARAARDR